MLKRCFIKFIFSLIVLNKTVKSRELQNGNGLFDKFHSINISMAETAFEDLRHEKWFDSEQALRDDLSFLCDPRQKPYNWYSADVTMNGVEFNNIGIRKKGYIGSVIRAELFPSLKLAIQKFGNKNMYFNGSSSVSCKNKICDERKAHSHNETKILTLNNLNQDKTSVTTCMILYIFEKMGVPAPRCSFANVTVNGVHRGVYTNIEPIQKPFLRRVFGDDSGDLYEGTLSDLSEGNLLRMEKKTNNKDTVEEAFNTMLETMKIKDDGEFLTKIKEILDLPEFLRLCMVEAMTNMDDGYSANRNNFYAYFDVYSKKWHFIPWSPDRGLQFDFIGVLTQRPETASNIWYTQTALTRRLYNIAEVRAMYKSDMERLLINNWNTTEMLEVFHDMLNLTYPGAKQRFPLLSKKYKKSVTSFELLYTELVSKMNKFLTLKKELLLTELRESKVRPIYPDVLLTHDDFCTILTVMSFIPWIVAIVSIASCLLCSSLLMNRYKISKTTDKPPAAEVVPVVERLTTGQHPSLG